MPEPEHSVRGIIKKLDSIILEVPQIREMTQILALDDFEAQAGDGYFETKRKFLNLRDELALSGYQPTENVLGAHFLR